MELSLDELQEFILQGREIEFYLNKIKYFLSYKWDESKKADCFPPIYIYNDTLGETVFCGTLEELLEYQFQTNVSLKSSIQEFEFDYIL